MLTAILSCFFLYLSFQIQKQLVENNDAVFDDGVAPELALDFDCQHVDSTEGLLSWLGGLGGFVALYQFVKYTDPESKNPIGSNSTSRMSLSVAVIIPLPVATAIAGSIS